MQRWVSCWRSDGGKKRAAEIDIWRLKSNWVFVLLASLVRGINYSCVIPTNHQFIINPPAEDLNITNQKIEPGLGESETFYSLTYVILFAGYTVSAVSCGALFNFIPTWYLFMASTLCHTFGYTLYAMATNGWMMLVSRALTGLSLGAVESLAFSYLGVSFEKYVEDLKILGEYDKKRAVKQKGFLFSSYNIGKMSGFSSGIAFPVILARFPNVPQFRPAAWFCVAAGVALILLQLLMFHGECGWHRRRNAGTKTEKKMDAFAEENEESQITTFLPEKKLNLNQHLIGKAPIVMCIIGGVKGMRAVIQEVLVNPILSDQFGFSDQATTYFFLVFFIGPPTGTLLLFLLQFFKVKSYGLTLLGMITTITSLLFMTDWQAIGHDPCMDYSLLHHPHLIDQYKLELAEANVSETGLVSVQALLVVDNAVYQLAVQRCEFAGPDCHWIPNSLVTHDHCSDCQPICRSTEHTLGFPQFTIGISLLAATTSLLYIGAFLLLSETVNKRYQGISTGCLVALMGMSRCVAPILFDTLYELAGKRTYLVMLIQVCIYTPLLIALLALYPWLGGKYKIQYYQENKDKADEEDEEKTGLISDFSQEKQQ